jgi:hypothetical protein
MLVIYVNEILLILIYNAIFNLQTETVRNYNPNKGLGDGYIA